MNTQAILLKYTKYSVVLFTIINMLFLVLFFVSFFSTYITDIKFFLGNYLYENIINFVADNMFGGASFFYVIGLVIHADMYRLFTKTLTVKLLFKHGLMLFFLESFITMMSLRIPSDGFVMESYYYAGIVFSCVYGFILLKCLYRFFKKDKSFAQKPTVKMRFLDMFLYIVEMLVVSIYFIIYSVKVSMMVM